MTLPKGYGNRSNPPPRQPKNNIVYGRFGKPEITFIIIGIIFASTTIFFSGEDDDSRDGILILPSASSSASTTQTSTTQTDTTVTTTSEDINIEGEDYTYKTFEGGKIVVIRWFNSEGKAWHDSNMGQWSNDDYYPVLLGQSGSVYYRCDGICPTSHQMDEMRPRIMSVSGLTWIDCNGGQCYYVYPDGRRVLAE